MKGNPLRQENLSPDQMKDIQSQILTNLSQLEGKKILVVGDVGLDEYVMGDVGRISPEAPVPVVDVKKQEVRVGLAANVAQNVTSLGGHCRLLGVTGQDSDSQTLQNLLKESGVDTSGLVVDESRPTTKKTRVMAGHHHIVRVDYEHRKFISPKVESCLLEAFEESVEGFDGVVLQDYAKGLLSENLTQQIIEKTHKFGKKIIVDPHRTTPVSYYQGADLFKPNRDEAFILSGLNIDDLREKADSFVEVGLELKSKVMCEYLVLTRGREGLSLFDEKGISHIPTYARQVFDVTGAGDTVLAALAIGWFAGLPLNQVCILANFAAGVVVGKVGCVPCTLNELKEYMVNHSTADS